MSDFRYKTRFIYPNCDHSPLCSNKGAYLPAITAAYLDNPPIVKALFQFTDGTTSQTLKFWANNSIGTQYGHIKWTLDGRWLTINWGNRVDVCLMDVDKQTFRGRDNPNIYGVLVEGAIE